MVKKYTEPTKSVTIYIPESLHSQLMMVLYDPARQRTSYGAKSELFTKLLRDWLARRAEGLEEFNVETDTDEPEGEGAEDVA